MLPLLGLGKWSKGRDLEGCRGEGMLSLSQPTAGSCRLSSGYWAVETDPLHVLSISLGEMAVAQKHVLKRPLGKMEPKTKTCVTLALKF